MNEDIIKIKNLLIKHKKKNFWGALHFLILSGYNEMEAYDLSFTLYPEIVFKEIFVVLSVDDKLEIAIIDEGKTPKNIMDVINFGLKNGSKFANFPLKVMEHYIINFKIKVLLEFLIAKLIEGDITVHYSVILDGTLTVVDVIDSGGVIDSGEGCWS